MSKESRRARGVGNSTPADTQTVGTPAVQEVDGIADARTTLQRLEQRLNMLETSVSRLLDALVVREVSSNGARADASAVRQSGPPPNDAAG